MATDKFIEFNGTEIVNLSRTVQLADAMGIETVWLTPESVEWIQTAEAGAGYDSVTNAPWFDIAYPASAEFAGIVPLGFPGLDDSTTEAATQEYVTDGGRSGGQRNATLPIVASVSLIALTDRGAEYGKRWLDRVLRSKPRAGCSGTELRYYRYPDVQAPIAHRRQVRLTRGTNVTRKRKGDCSVVWLATFTLTCDDPFEYSEPETVLTELGSETPVGGEDGLILSGSSEMVQESCPVFDYTPIYDPLYPALVPSPVSPEFYPAGWSINEGDTFLRYYVRLFSPEPHTLNVVPVVALTTDTDVRMVRFSIWPSDSPTNDQCGALFSAVLSYLPATGTFYIDGEQKASYLWDGFSEAVRRTDSLVYAPDAKPIQWTAFNDPESLLVTLDVFYVDDLPFEGNVRASLSFVQKSD